MSSRDTLCCCEYENMKGEKSHILASCCECEALDEMVDRCFKCEKIPTHLVDRFIDTVIDRFRIPGILGGGASRINPEVAVPVILVPTSLFIAATGPLATCLVLAILPYFCFFFYRTWKRKTNKTRTQFFFVWGLASVLYMFILFEVIICRQTNISNIDNVLISAGTICMFVALMYAKKDPGVVAKRSGNQQGKTSVASRTGHQQGRMYQGYLPVSMTDDIGQDQFDVGEDFEIIEHSDIEVMKHEAGEQYVGSRPAGGAEQTSSDWCESCADRRPARGGHCPVCAVCIRNRDHHCVWIDSCVGVDNHRSFLVTMVLFVLVGYYGSYMTLSAVCDPVTPHTAICPLHIAYRDFKWGLCYAAAWYVSMVTSIMCIGVIHQVILISQNLTSQELHAASRLGNTQWLVYSRYNPHNRGILQNWKDFLLKQRATQTYETV